MKVSVFKNFLNGERITACGVDELVRIIRDGDYADAISDYRCASPRMLSVGRGGEARQWAVDTADNRIPRLCFASEYRRQGGVRRLVGRNGLVLLEIDNLADFPTAVSLRNEAARQPFTLMAFVGASTTMNSIITKTTYDQSTGGQTTTYTNVDGVWSANGMVMFTTPFGNRNWHFSNHAFLRFSRTVGFNNELLNRSSSYTVSETPSLAYRTDLIDFELRPYYNLQRATPFSRIPTAMCIPMAHVSMPIIMHRSDWFWAVTFLMAIQADTLKVSTTSSGFGMQAFPISSCATVRLRLR